MTPKLIHCGTERITIRRPPQPGEVHVGVFTHKRRSGSVFYMAYTRDYNPTWEGCCEHTIEAGPKAKERAIAQHKAECRQDS